MKRTKEDTGSIVTKGILYPAAAVGSGMFLGSLAGGTLAKALAGTPGLSAKLKRMTPAQREVFLRRLRMGTGAIGGASGAGVSALSYSLLKKELDKREKASQKTAMYSAFFDELRASA